MTSGICMKLCVHLMLLRNKISFSYKVDNYMQCIIERMVVNHKIGNLTKLRDSLSYLSQPDYKLTENEFMICVTLYAFGSLILLIY